MDEPSKPDLLKELHGDLVRKYKKHGAAVESIWRSFDKGQRTKCMKAGAADGVVLKHSLDRSLGDVYKIIPEWNLRDMTEPDSDVLLNLLKYRATKTLCEQYCAGVNGGPGDRHLIEHMMDTKGLRCAHPFKNCYTLFVDGEHYGMSYEIVAKEALAGLQPSIQAGLCIPQSTGELVLERQVILMQSLNIIIEDILDQGSKTRTRKERPKKPEEVVEAALSKLTIRSAPAKLALPDLLASAREQQDSVREYLSLLSTEPVVLSHAVNIWFFSRPELVPDERGRQLPVHTDKYTSASFFEAIHSSIQGVAIWTYLTRLLELLKDSTADKAHRALILQEISNVCHLEFSRAQNLFKRHVQTGTGSKWFKRMSNAYDNAGNARVNLKGNPEDLTRSDPQLHYMLRLCQAKLTVSNAANWLKKLGELHQAHPEEWEKLQERETDSLGDLAIIIGFIQDLAPVIAMPSSSNNKGQAFVSRSQALEKELSALKGQIDLRDFVVPIDNLLEPGVAEDALKVLDEFTIGKAGTKMGSIYHDLIEHSLSNLQSQYQEVKAKMEQGLKYEPPTPSMPTESTELRVQQRRQREKTRPPHSSIYEAAKPVEPSGGKETAPSTPTFKIDASTAEVFTRLFAKSQARGPVSWESFGTAMANLGFSVLPKYGSVYTFYPPDNMTVKKPFTIHRPHQSRIEGYRTLILARRLKRMYGWDEGTFQVN